VSALRTLDRDGQGTWRVLEDNLRCPSGRGLLPGKPAVIEADVPRTPVRRAHRPADRRLPLHRVQTLHKLAPWTDTPKVGCCSRQGCSTAPTSSTVFLAQQMGIQLVEGAGSGAWRKTPGSGLRSTAGLELVILLIYRRIDDDFP